MKAARLEHAARAEQQQHVARLDGGVMRRERGDGRREGDGDTQVDGDVAHPREHADAAGCGWVCGEVGEFFLVQFALANTSMLACRRG